MQADELRHWLRLTVTPGVGNHTARRLLAAFGSPAGIFEQDRAALRQLTTTTQATALQREPEPLAALLDATLAWLEQPSGGVTRRVVSLGDPLYPASLLATEDPPLMLYLLGQAPTADAPDAGADFWPEQALAMVGSRTPTPQGALDAGQFARALCEVGLCIVSGLALGVDGAAHQGALNAVAAGASTWPATIAVIGTGVDRVYPRQNRALAHDIAEHGLIVSEYPLGTGPLPGNFPKRNRLIAGLSRGTLVVEAARRSGSLITARLALEQGKEVLAIPGSIHSPLSRGPHTLIRQGARLVETAQDVLEELTWASAPAVRSPDPGGEAEAAGADDPEGILQALGGDPLGLDALQARTGLDTATLQARLLELELDGRVGRLPGGLFQRLQRA